MLILAQGQAGEVAAPESNFERTGKHRVLVVDDSADVLDALKATLEAALPVVVDTAGSGADALARMAAVEYDLIVSDQGMPGMDGLTFLRKAREATPTSARIMITGATDFELAVKAINEGAITGFFPKPIDARTLVEKVRTELEARHQAIVAKRGHDTAAEQFRAESIRSSGYDVGRPFTGSLRDSTRR